jgi:hypothetical protein
MGNIFNLLNPWYRPALVPIKYAGMNYGLHAVTNLLAKCAKIENRTARTVAKIAAFTIDLFTAIIGNPTALVYNNTFAVIQNIFIRCVNKKLKKSDLEARKSWKPTSYKAIGIDLLIIASVAAIGIAGYKAPSSVLGMHSPADQAANWKSHTATTWIAFCGQKAYTPIRLSVDHFGWKTTAAIPLSIWGVSFCILTLYFSHKGSSENKSNDLSGK